MREFVISFRDDVLALNQSPLDYDAVAQFGPCFHETLLHDTVRAHDEKIGAALLDHERLGRYYDGVLADVEQQLDFGELSGQQDVFRIGHFGPDGESARPRVDLRVREIDEAAADQSLRAIVRFLNSRGIIRSETAPGHASSIITNADMTSVSATSAGLLRRVKFAGAHVRRGEQLAFIINPCDGSVREVLKAPVTGMLFFMQDGPFITEHSPVFQVLAGA